MSETLSYINNFGDQIGTAVGSVNSFGSAVTALGTISQLFTGNGPITLGTFAFQAFEIPESVSYGGAQQLTIHKRPGGSRTIHAMGPDDKAIEWSGSFLSPDAATRSQTLAKLKAAGNPLPLTFGQNYFEVVIQSVDLTMRNTYQVDYRIACAVLSVGKPPSSKPSLLQSITDDIGNAIGVNIPQTLSQVSSALGPIQSAAQTLTSLTGGSSAALGLLSKVQGLSSINTNLSNLANGNITSLSGFTSSISGVSAGVSSIGNAVTAAGNAAGTASVGGFLGRMVKNLV